MSLVASTSLAFLQVVAAYIVTDFLTGVYHFITDKGWNFSHQVKLFQIHHATNTMDDDFDWQPMLVAIPGMMLGLWLESPFVLALASFGVLAQVPHWYAHHPSNSQFLRPIISWLQQTGIIISPKHHAAHHREPFDHNFCIFSGWNNWWMNRAIRACEHSDYAPGMAMFPVWSIVGGLVVVAAMGSGAVAVLVAILYSAGTR